MLLYSSDAPVGWNALPTPIKQKFYDISQKGDWTATEAYDHLVPDTLKDNPDEVQAWMDGDPSLGINDKDVSRIESGENGGEYSVDNTVMEDMSVNRSRGSDNMTETEYATTVEQNATDVQTIETSFNGSSEAIKEVEVSVFGSPETTTLPFDPSQTSPYISTDSQAIATNNDFFASYLAEADSAVEATEATSFAASATSATATAVETGTEAFDFFATTGEVIGQVATPVVLAMKAGRAFSKDPDEQAGAAVCVGTIASVGMFTPAAPLIGIGALGWTLWGLGEGFINWLNNDPPGTPVKW